MCVKKTVACMFFFATSLLVAAQSVYTIYPVPHSQQLLGTRASFTKVVNVVADASIDNVTVARIKELLASKGLSVRLGKEAKNGLSNVFLGVAHSNGVANKIAKKWHITPDVIDKKGKFDKHLLYLTSQKGRANVLILGENTDATFYGIASLEQILDNGTQNLACVKIDDYADIQYRGVIEGYYGVPYTAETTKDLFRFMARYKMNSYMYGAKSDPYHSQKWEEPYPDSITSEQKAIGYLSAPMLRDITKTAHNNKVNFIWAIHPGSAFTQNKDNNVIGRIMNKFEKMYQLGVRQFGIFVDDIGVPLDSISLSLNAKRLTEAQQTVEAMWNKTYKSAADTVKPINFVPQLYAYSWFNDTVRHNFFKALSHTPKQVVVYITGAKIWSVPNSHDLSVVSKSFGRPLAWWWNYPCNDNDMSKLFVSDTYTNFADERWIDNNARLEATLNGASALISNPMQQGTASKIALFGLGDYAWNHKGFDNEKSYRAALCAVVGKQRAKAFCHVSKYLRYYDDNPLKDLIAAYKKDGKTTALKAEMELLINECNTFEVMKRSANEPDSLLYADIKPWIEKVSDMAFLIHEMLTAIDAKREGKPFAAFYKNKLLSLAADLDDNGKYKFSILDGMGDDIKLSRISAEPSQKVMRPFITFLAKQLQGE
nr:beta-N-acetylglucosaminidase domain-containing protein [uncultured Prevotella sp.]